MTRYETITALGDTFVKLMGKSFIPVHILEYKLYYEAYLKDWITTKNTSPKCAKLPLPPPLQILTR